NRVGASTPRGVDDVLNLQVTLAGCCRSDAFGLIGFAHMWRAGIRFRIDRNGGDAHLPARADHTPGDFTSIGDEYSPNHELQGLVILYWASPSWPRACRETRAGLPGLRARRADSRCDRRSARARRPAGGHTHRPTGAWYSQWLRARPS